MADGSVTTDGPVITDGRSTHPLVALTSARLKLMLREPEMVFWVFVFPILMALALGIAFESREDDPLPVGVRDAAGASALLATLRSSPALDVVLMSEADESSALRDGRAHLVVVPGATPVLRYDPARPESRLTRLLVEQALRGEVAPATERAQVEEVAIPGNRYIDWLVPGLLGMNIMGTGMWGVGFAVVVARSRRLLKRMMATPMRRSHFLASLVLARLAFLGLEMLVLLGFAWWFFGVSVEGRVWDLVVVALVGALMFGGIGLLTSSRARTIEGVSGIMNVVMVPMWVASGVFFASSNFPDAVQPAIRALPLTALIDALRGVMLDGDPLAGVWSEIAVMAAWSAGSFGVALRWFRWF